MLNQLLTLTATEPYHSSGGMKVLDISIQPFNTPDAKLVLEIHTDDGIDNTEQTWELTCIQLAQTEGIPQFVIPRTQLKLYNDHPVLWRHDDMVYFSITGKVSNIPALMGDLFIEHSKACGNWVDFHSLYQSFPETLATQRDNQLAIPVRLKDSCFRVLERHGVQHRVNEVQPKFFQFSVLFFSKDSNWPDEVNFNQFYIIAREFSARRIS